MPTRLQAWISALSTQPGALPDRYVRVKRTLIALVVLAAAAPTAWSGSVASAVPPSSRPPTASRAAAAADQPPPYAANRKATIKLRFRAAVRGLAIAQQTPRGYDRD